MRPELVEGHTSTSSARIHIFRSAAGLVDRGSSLAVDIVLGDDLEAGLHLWRNLTPFQGGHSSVYAVLPNHSRLLRHQGLNSSLFESLNLVWAGVKANDLDLLLLASLANTGGGAFCGEQIGREHANDVWILL